MNQKKKYRVNLPKTSFSMKASLSMREPERLKVWAQEGLEKRLEEKAQKFKKRFILHDGPPYANGHIHMGHALNKTLKDMVVRYKTHLAYQTHYVPGWDCHGLPIEHALLKEMGQEKEHVVQIDFRRKARAYAKKYVKIQAGEFQRLGISGLSREPYLTMNPQYQASIAKSFYELHEKGFIYRGEKPVYWSIGCETALAEAELEYQDKTSQAIFVSFPIPHTEGLLKKWGVDPKTSMSFLIWTTTPWTLPANVGIALNAQLEYGMFQVDPRRVVIFATALQERLQKKLEWESIRAFKCVSGKELKEIIPQYQHPFIQREGQVILAGYVSSEEGTGIVHIAPGHGEDDYVYGHLQNGLEILSPVDHKGCFTEDFGEELQVKGENVFKANQKIIQHLKKQGFLWGVEDHQHSYPFCWRSKTPVIVRSTPQWFLKVDHEGLRDQLKKIIQDETQTRWIPEWGKKRILGMIESRPDWCLSRQRLWGVPIPVAFHKESGEPYLESSFQKQVLKTFETEGADAWFTHPKEFFFQGQKVDPNAYRLEQDILDVWFDSGVSHQAVLEKDPALGFPSDLYLEGSDQHRGWFQTSLITATALRKKAPFRQVLTHGFVVDGRGKKMSKSLGNVVSPQEVIKTYGADILRLWVSSCDTHQDIRLSPEIMKQMAEAYRKIRNTFRYLLGNISDFSWDEHHVSFKAMDSIDRWALSRLQEVVREVTGCYERYHFHRIYQLVYDYCITDLSSFYLDALKDRLYCDGAADPLRRSSQTVLFTITKALSQLLAPILIFTTDEVWRTFPLGSEKSVHESLWDEGLWSYSDERALYDWSTIREIRAQSDVLIEKMRESKQVGSSLDCQIFLKGGTPELDKYLKERIRQLEMGLIVSHVTLGNSTDRYQESSCEVVWHDSQGRAQKGQVNLQIVKATGQKCARCWRYREEVGALENPQLCERCFHVERSLDSDKVAS
jgi:isoleucyl-tRNA synthetase